MRRNLGTLMLGTMVGTLVACGGDAPPPPKPPETTAVAQPATPPSTPTTAETTPPPAPQPTLGELEKQTGQAMAAGFNAHDAKKIASLYTDNAIVRVAGMPQDMTGPDAIAKGFQGLFDTFSNFKSAPRMVFVKGDTVAIINDINATHSGNFMGVKATEKPVGWTSADILMFDPSGKVREQHVYWDIGTVMSQIGASKMHARAIPELAAQATVVVSTGSDTEQKNLDLMKTLTGSFEKKSATDFLSIITDDTQWDDNVAPATMKGTAEAKKYFDGFEKAFPDAKATASSPWAAGDYVISENVMTGTNTGPFMGKAPTKKAVTLHGVDIAQFSNGKVVHGWSFGNGAEMAMQLGWIPMPKADNGAKSGAPPMPAKK